MSPERPHGHVGLCLPPDIMQPFILRFRRDDLHVMAFFKGHPDYEAVEAMVRFRGEDFSIRAILTRHDQTQIDHVNDDALLAEAQGVHRQTCFRVIAFRTETEGSRQRARLAFLSHAGESIVLDLVTLARPSAEHGGLSDPGRHSPDSSLPLMWRGASALAGPETRVTIDGRDYETPVKFRAGTFVAHEGYCSAPHAMGVIRAGTVAMRLLSRPDRICVGAEWVFESNSNKVVYRIAECCAAGNIRIERSGDGREVITALVVNAGLQVSQILRTEEGTEGGFGLSFDAGRFALSIDGAQALVTGRVEWINDADGSSIGLIPEHPSWSTARAVKVACSKSGDEVRLVTTIGNR